MIAQPALPTEVIAALEAAHFEPDPSSHDWRRAHFAYGVVGALATVLNPWDCLDEAGVIQARFVEYRFHDGVSYVVRETPFPADRLTALAAAIHDWQQTLPESESEL